MDFVGGFEHCFEVYPGYFEEGEEGEDEGDDAYYAGDEGEGWVGGFGDYYAHCLGV